MPMPLTPRHVRRPSHRVFVAAGALAVGASNLAAFASTPQDAPTPEPSIPGRPPVRLATIGDSLTDEYIETPWSYAQTWTQQLVAGPGQGRRGVDMGPLPTAATWGPPRGRGFQENWALAGATTDTAIASGQHLGVAEGVRLRGVTHAVVFLGANDWASWTWRGSEPPLYREVYYDRATAAEIEAYASSRLANYRVILDRLRGPQGVGVPVVLAAAIDFSITPQVAAGYPDPAGREKFSAIVRGFNTRLRALAREYDAVFVDTYALTKAIYGENNAVRATLLVGGTPIDLTGRDTPRGENPATGWVHDGVHPGTVVQGIFANVFATALNIGFRAGVPLLPEDTILATAGLPGSGVESVPLYIGPYSRYVVLPGDAGCTADLTSDGLTRIDDLFEYLSRFFEADPAADLDGVPGLGFGDLAAYFSAWFAGCP